MGGSHETGAGHHDDAGDFSSRDIGIAFALTIFAGLATVVGGAIVFFTTTQRFNPRLLSGGLALAAGAIIYIAFADLLPEGTEFFAADAGSEKEEQLSTLWSTLCLFSGAGLMALWSVATHRLKPTNHAHGLPQKATSTRKSSTMEASTEEPEGDLADSTSDADEEDPALNTIQDTEPEDNDSGSYEISVKEKTSLCQSGISTAIALIMHSLPEGLVTFITTAQDPAIGAALAIGIAIHNVMEGMSIALPIYFATNQKCKAFGTSALAGLAPVVGGLIGYAILETANFSNTAFGVMFGLAAGMLIYIAVKELLKTAYKYDAEDKVTTLCFFLGMALIALALVILESTGNHNHAVGGGGHSHD